MILFSLIFILSVLTTWVIRKVILKRNIVDIPNHRSSHQIPIPRGGGLTIVIFFFIGSCYLVWQKQLDSSLFIALCGGLAVAVVGFLDDIKPVRPLYRSLVHLAAALWAAYWLKGLPVLNLGSMQLPIYSIGYLVAVIGIIWCTNLYNFMDGIDGLAASEGLFISFAAAFFLLQTGNTGLIKLCLLLAASISGFLVWNWQPARIFMGDIASGYLGFVFAVLAINTQNVNLLPLTFWIVITAVFTLDATFTLFKRVLKRKKWYEGHREHAYQQLVSFGISHQVVTISISIFNLVILLPIVYSMFLSPQWSLYLSSLVILSLFTIWLIITNWTSMLSKLFFFARTNKNEMT